MNTNGYWMFHVIIVNGHNANAQVLTVSKPVA